ncbi:hypothetical protein F383_28525 [Gossypium arboreum]|uniref:Uncharacterized protein n=1 Tax=Gossypium arboreum TaxID=29729 RepID=A0A0B0MUE4_GOSAR|nr:hypothetical protein F383_28525 [Gossypium arboreum]
MVENQEIRNLDLDRGKAKLVDESQLVVHVLYTECHRASIGDQGTSEASITLSPEALVGVSKGGKKAW